MISTLLAIVLLPALAFSKPINKRMIDLDSNGVPDWCVPSSDGSYECLENGQWTSVAAAATAAPTIATQAPTTTKAITLPTGQLPEVSQFQKDNGTKWKLEYVGDIQYTGAMATKDVVGDKCRSSKLGSKIIWNCGDMMCNGVNCGFSMGAAMYGTDSVMKINTDTVNNWGDATFLEPWSGDPTPQGSLQNWGMDTSNIAHINDTHGVAYAWEIWRGSGSEASYVDRGNAVASVTLGDKAPVAQRVGPLLTGPDAIQLGLVAILRDQNYVYIYSAGGPSGLIVSRVTASDDVFDASKYQTLQYGTTNWVNGIPGQKDNRWGMSTPDGKFGCAVYGSVFYNNYLNKYMIICNVFQSFVNMYTSDTPYGPWSSQYQLIAGWIGYGSMAHPEYSLGGSHKELYFSQGPNTKFNMFKLTLNYE